MSHSYPITGLFDERWTFCGCVAVIGDLVTSGWRPGHPLYSVPRALKNKKRGKKKFVDIFLGRKLGEFPFENRRRESGRPEQHQAHTSTIRSQRCGRCSDVEIRSRPSGQQEPGLRPVHARPLWLQQPCSRTVCYHIQRFAIAYLFHYDSQHNPGGV